MPPVAVAPAEQKPKISVDYQAACPGCGNADAWWTGWANGHAAELDIDCPCEPGSGPGPERDATERPEPAWMAAVREQRERTMALVTGRRRPDATGRRSPARVAAPSPD